MTTSLKVGLHAVVTSDIQFGGYPPVLTAGEKVFISSLAPLTVAREDGCQVQVSPFQIQVSRGRPKSSDAVLEIVKG